MRSGRVPPLTGSWILPPCSAPAAPESGRAVVFEGDEQPDIGQLEAAAAARAAGEVAKRAKRRARRPPQIASHSAASVAGAAPGVHQLRGSFYELLSPSFDAAVLPADPEHPGCQIHCLVRRR